jgi:hypothetical protein
MTLGQIPFPQDYAESCHKFCSVTMDSVSVILSLCVCRYMKCLNQGMRREAVQEERGIGKG